MNREYCESFSLALSYKWSETIYAIKSCLFMTDVPSSIQIYSAKKEGVHTLKGNKFHISAWISMKLLTQLWVSVVH